MTEQQFVDFYPTPVKLIQKMLEGVKLDNLCEVLEPSAGKGDICDYIMREYDEYSTRRRSPQLDVIECNLDLQHILKGKKYRLIHDDFLTFRTDKCYDLIIANFPFSDGDRHLQKAVALIEQSGGQLICLINAETLRNPYTNLRLALVHALERLNASIEFLSAQFADAERKTDVEVALIRLTVERGSSSILLASLEHAAAPIEESSDPEASLIERDFRKAAIARFNLESELGIRLIDEYFALLPYVTNRIRRPDDKHDYSQPLIKLEVTGAYLTRGSHVNAYLAGIREKYWAVLIQDPRFNSGYTSNILKELAEKLTELREYDFNLFNISELERELASKIMIGIEKAILDMFDEFSRKYAYDSSFNEGNIHYFNGWKTNKAHRINEKVILPINGFSSYSPEKDKLDGYYIRDRLRDIVKVFNYLSDRKVDVPALVGEVVELANITGRFRSMKLRFFETTFFKKGTCHIKFTDRELLDKFNIFGSQRKGWLPPAYGKKSYDEMDAEERAVIDDFQGREKYDEVMFRSDFYLVDTATLLLMETI